VSFVNSIIQFHESYFSIIIHMHIKMLG